MASSTSIPTSRTQPRMAAAMNRRNMLRCRAQSTAAVSASPLTAAITAGKMQLKHRVVMAPMTRLRMEPGSEKPMELTQLFYEQRATEGGLLITEAIQVDSVHARGYVRAPVLERQDQVEAWAKVVQRVHAKGGYVFAQLQHSGRVSHNSLNSSGRIFAPSAIAAQGSLYVEGGVKEPYSVPHAMTVAEIQQTVQTFARAARDAVKGAGFDGVEFHCSNGYLLQQFLSKKTNQRTDEYGGSVEKRARFLLEVVDAAVAEVGSDRVAVKLNPGVTFSDLVEPEDEVRETLAYLLPQLDKRGLAYLHVANANDEPYFRFVGLDKPNLSFDLHREVRKHFKGVYMANGALSIEKSEEYVQEGTADLFAFGTAFMATPNIPALVAAGKKTKDLNMSGANPALWYSKNPSEDAKNYTDFPDLPL